MEEGQTRSAPPAPGLVAAPIYGAALIGLAIMGLLLGFLRFSGFGPDGGNLTDFHGFYAVSELVRRGLFDDAYRFAVLHRVESALGGDHTFLAWLYPPQFGLVVAPLSFLPINLAYLLFTGVELLAYALTLRRLAGPALGGALLLVLPCLLLNVATGQNGLLTGTLIGLFCIGWLGGSAWAGLPLGLMVVKPHLAVGFGLYVLLRGDRRAMATAVAAIAATSALATWAFGAHVWLAFASGMREMQLFLRQGLYPFFRMASLYASLRSFGAGPAAAAAAQALCALAGLFLVLAARFEDAPPARRLAFVTLASLLFSPYLYDYDLASLGVAFALLAPDLSQRASTGRLAAIACLAFVATAAGIASSTALVLRYGAAGSTPTNPEPTIGAFALLALIATLVWTVRNPAKAAASEPQRAAA